MESAVIRPVGLGWQEDTDVFAVGGGDVPGGGSNSRRTSSHGMYLIRAPPSFSPSPAPRVIAGTHHLVDLAEETRTDRKGSCIGWARYLDLSLLLNTPSCCWRTRHRPPPRRMVLPPPFSKKPKEKGEIKRDRIALSLAVVPTERRRTSPRSPRSIVYHPSFFHSSLVPSSSLPPPSCSFPARKRNGHLTLLTC